MNRTKTTARRGLYQFIALVFCFTILQPQSPADAAGIDVFVSEHVASKDDNSTRRLVASGLRKIRVTLVAAETIFGEGQSLKRGYLTISSQKAVGSDLLWAGYISLERGRSYSLVVESPSSEEGFGPGSYSVSLKHKGRVFSSTFGVLPSPVDAEQGTDLESAVAKEDGSDKGDRAPAETSALAADPDAGAPQVSSNSGPAQKNAMQAAADSEPAEERQGAQGRTQIAGAVTEIATASGNIALTLAEGVTDEGLPVRPSKVFSEDTEAIFLVLQSAAAKPQGLSLRLFAEDVEASDPDRPIFQRGSSLRPGQSVSLAFNPPPGGYRPGKYRVEVEPRGAAQLSIPFTIEPRYPWAKGLDEVERPQGLNIALAALGGRIEGVTSELNDQGHAAERLIDGWRFTYKGNSNNCQSCGWSSRDQQLPQEILLSFRERREAEIAAVVINPVSWRIRDRNPNKMAKHVEIWVSVDRPDGGFERVASAPLRQEPVEQAILLPEGTSARYLKVVVTSNFGGTTTEIGEIGIIERNSAESSILEDLPINIARPELGGALVSFGSSLSGQGIVDRLIDGDEAGAPWQSSDDYLPQDFVFAFRDDQPALIDRVILSLSKDGKPDTWPRRASLLVSDRSPLDGFEEVARFEIEQRPGAQVFSIGREARFLKLRLFENYGGRRTTLNEVAIIEGQAPGYRPILLRKDLTRPSATGKVAETPEIGPAAEAEIEPNDSTSQANALPLDVFTRGSIDPLGENDHFALDPEIERSGMITFDLIGRPNIRTALKLLDGEGQTLQAFDPGRLPEERTSFSWRLTGRERYAQVSEPEVSVVLIWDTSGSMKGSTADLEGAVRAYIDQIPESQRVRLMRFGAKIEVLLNDFSSDKSELRSAIEGQFLAVGGTRFYEAVGDATELLAEVGGNRAIVVMTDGADTTSRLKHPAFWRLLEDQRIRLYVIGLGETMRDYLPRFGSTGARVLGHVAQATNGRMFFAEESSELAAFYEKIATELHRTSTYHLRPRISRGTGRFDVVSTGERIARVAVPHVELILEASGSMREKKRKIDGRLKIDVAKDVMREVIGKMPEGTEVALRVYGRRIREGKTGDCQDTELLYPMRPINRQRMLKAVDKIEALGTTPIAFSLEKAAQDFGNKSGEKIIVLVTDGKEECGGDPKEIAAKLVDQGLNLRVNVVGFALADEGTKEDMRAVAAVTGGQYFDAADQEGLAGSLEQAMSAPFALTDAAGTRVAAGVIGGEPVEAPEGIYTLVVQAVGEPVMVTGIRIQKDKWTRVELKKEGQEVASSVLALRPVEDLYASSLAPSDSKTEAAPREGKETKPPTEAVAALAEGEAGPDSETPTPKAPDRREDAEEPSREPAVQSERDPDPGAESPSIEESDIRVIEEINRT